MTPCNASVSNIHQKGLRASIASLIYALVKNEKVNLTLNLGRPAGQSHLHLQADLPVNNKKFQETIDLGPELGTEGVVFL